MYWQGLQVTVQPGRRAELLQRSKGYVEECVAEEPGTRAFTFLLDEQDADRFYAIEQYADRAAHHAHSGGPVMQRHGPAIVPLLAGPPVLLASGDQVAVQRGPHRPGSGRWLDARTRLRRLSLEPMTAAK